MLGTALKEFSLGNFPQAALRSLAEDFGREMQTID